ncbi:MAG TPA: hypothetical protein VFR03_21265 [Thermoanaerobaculia bacterium]|nr:hypothetical protein [Thermoanaerobaculia bacterium]
MKRQIFTLLMVLVLATGTVLMAQSTNTQVPPSQQVDQSGQPEHSGRPDVDVDTGKNANNGVLNVDVKRHGDSDTKAGNNPNGNKMDTTGQYNGTTSSTTTTGTSTTTGSTSDMSGTASNLPRTASDMPLLGLLGALSLAGALGLRKLH